MYVHKKKPREEDLKKNVFYTTTMNKCCTQFANFEEFLGRGKGSTPNIHHKCAC